jgi:hypothetical protein
LQNDRHQKWSTYLQQFHINIKYKTCISNRVADCLSRPPMVALTTVLHSCGHETSEWPQLYQQDLDFATTYQLLGTCSTVSDFHIQDGLLCHLGHLCVPTRKRAKLIWEAHYSRVAGHFGVEKTVVILQKHFYWPKLRQDVKKYIDASDYDVGIVLTQHGHPMAYHSETHSLILSVNTPSMTSKCIPFYKHVVEGNITFWRQRRSYTLITSLYSPRLT